jgi:hypothetical protein
MPSLLSDRLRCGTTVREEEAGIPAKCLCRQRKRIAAAHLSDQTRTASFPAMLSPRSRTGVRAGLVAAAATAGAIAGFALRHGDWSSPFAILGQDVLFFFGVTGAPAALAVGVGVTGHMAWMVLWGLVFALVAWRRAFAPTLVAAFVIAAGTALLARSMIPAAMGAVGFSALPAVQVALCIVLMTAGFVTGKAAAGAE